MTPLTRGGSNSAENLCLSHKLCNLRKGAMTAAEYFALLDEVVAEAGDALAVPDQDWAAAIGEAGDVAGVGADPPPDRSDVVAADAASGDAGSAAAEGTDAAAGVGEPEP